MKINSLLKVAAAILLLTCLMLAWWGWQNLDPSLLLFGSRLC
jgi:DNA-binding transcriptional regulator of glucitol operon